MNKRKFEHLVRAALIGWVRFNDFPSMAVFLILSLCLATACQRKARTDERPTDQTNQSRQSNQENQLSLDKGDLKLLYQPRKTPKAGSTVASNPQVLSQVVANLNEKIALPWDVTISFQDCDQPDAHYDPETRSITICYQLIDEYHDLFALKIKDKAKLDDAVRGAVTSTFFHELGHGLVDAWKLPVTGKEEDAVDQLSTLVLINNTDYGEQMALNGAVSFQLYAECRPGPGCVENLLGRALSRRTAVLRHYLSYLWSCSRQIFLPGQGWDATRRTRRYVPRRLSQSG
jgi:Putative metallopeptidase